MRIDAYKDNTIHHCRFCHMCHHACTVANATCNETDTTRGKLFTLFTLLAGSRSLGPELAELLTHCTTCRLCKEWCYSRYDAADVVEQARADLIDAGWVHQGGAAVRNNLQACGNPFGARPEDGRAFLAGLAAEGSGRRAGTAGPEILYYPGCTVLHRQQGIALAMARILQAAGISFSLPEEAACCGAFLHQLGFQEEARKLADANAGMLASMLASGRARTVVFSCPHCLKAFAADYRAWGVAVPEGVKLMHCTEYLASLLDSGRLRVVRRLGGPAALHDPCVLGRQMGVYDAPRRVLAHISDEVVEMTWNRNKARCCGAGGGLTFTNPGMAATIAGTRLAEARSAGVRMLATACPLCRDNLTAAEGGDDVARRDLSEALAELLG